MCKILVVAIAFAAVVVHARSARADVVWAMPGSGCIPADDTDAAGTYNTSGGYINFRGSTTGDIHLTCPITLTGSTGVEYFNATLFGNGTGTSTYWIQVVLRKLDGLTSTDVCSILLNNSGIQELGCDFTDFTLTGADFYYFYVRLHRDNDSFNPAFAGITLNN
jgi:hypothetical protein